MIQKLIFKKHLEKIKKKLEKTKLIKEEEKRKENHKKLIKAIWELTEDIEIYEDEQATIPTTQEHLQNKTLEELTKLLEEIINELQKQ